MKKTNFFRHFVETLPARFLLATMLLAPMGASAQVTIGSGALPQATLDIVGTYPTDADKGKAFRLDDGNQAPGKILTCGENGVGTWQLSTVSLIQGTWDDVNANEPLSTSKDAPTYTGLSVTLPPGKYMMFVQVGYTVIPNRVYHIYLGWGTVAGKFQSIPPDDPVSYKFLGHKAVPPNITTKTEYYLVEQETFIVDLTAATEDTTIYINSYRQVTIYTAASGIVDDPTNDVRVNQFPDEYSLNVISLH